MEPAEINETKSGKEKQQQKNTFLRTHISIIWLNDSRPVSLFDAIRLRVKEYNCPLLYASTSIFSIPAYDFLFNILHLIRIVDSYDFKQTNEHTKNENLN